MKKVFISSLCLFIGMMIFSINVHAASFKVNILGNNTFEDEITVYVQVSNLVDFDGVCGGLCGLVGTLEYDTDKIELISVEALENFDLTKGNRIVLYRTTGVQNGTQILSITFKNKSLQSGESTTIKFSDLVASDGDQDISATDASKVIQYVAKNEDVITNDTTDNSNESNNNQSTTNNQTTNNQSTNYSNKSSNNNLLSITISEGTLVFQEDTLVYDIAVGRDVEEITVEAELADQNASVSGIGTYKLEEGNNEIILVVTAEDGSEKEYVINVYREEAVNNEEDALLTDSSSQEKNNNSITFIFITTGVCLIVFVVAGIIWQKRKNGMANDSKKKKRDV